MKKLSAALLFCLLFAGNIYSQVPLWIDRFDGLHDSTDVARAVTTDSQGNVYVTGYSSSLILFTQIVTIKYSPAGVMLWNRSYGLILYNEGNAITVDDSSNVYVAGFSYGLLSLADMVVIKYNRLGVQQWVYRYNGTGDGMDNAYSLAVDAQHNVYVTGSSLRGLLILGNLDYATIKLNTNGVQQWVSTYDGPAHGNDIPVKIKKDQSNNIYVTGSSPGNSSSLDYATIKYNNNGVQQWAVRYNGPGNGIDLPNDMALDNSGNIIITGESKGSSTASDYATIKYNTAGTQQWLSRYNGAGAGEDRAYAIVVDNSDNVFITGESQGIASSFDYATLKYNPAGIIQYTARYNGPGNNEDRAYAIVVDNSDNVFVTGSSRNSSLSGSENYSTVKYNAAGTQQWAAIYNGSGNSTDEAYAITLDNSNNVIVTGSSRSGSLLGTEDYLTIKYSDSGLTGISAVSNTIPEKFNLFQNYPNPFNPSTKIKFDLPEQSDVKLAVYDMLGVEKAVLINQQLKAGEFEITWDGTNYSSGIYFYKIITGTRSVTRKMILIK